ncbi:hypothetical protein [Candidatus Thiosymbion oneisti]|uniref:hypothetical protein n=1 Tax=Candidatus Thiosymbion oneisti TaxID=589554 RepID=UPI000B80154B|nr:hypothetical protein [Candidatus Thiosymbion oneisti]
MIWLTDDRNRRAVIVAIACTAFFISFIFLNRWAFTELGVQSFGRLWHYYISYFDFGFKKRALFGTLLTELGLNKITSNEYVFAYVIYALKIFLFTALILYFCLRAVPFDNLVGYAVVFLSPAFILQSGYITGTQDFQLLIIMAILILFVKRDVWLTILSCVGVLMHELFIFFLPAIFFLHTYRSEPQWQITQRKVAHAVLLSLPVIIVIASVLFFGKIDTQEIPKASYEEVMEKRLPNTAYKRSLWGGYSELSRPIRSYTRSGEHVVRSLLEAARYIAIPLVYALSLAIVISLYLRESSLLLRLAVFLVSVFPIFAVFSGYDFYRWIGMSTNVSLLLMVYLSALKRIHVPATVLSFLLVFSCFAPFGGAELERPFPAHQLLLEKLVGPG